MPTANARSLTLSAVLAGVKEVRKVVDEAKRIAAEEGRPTLLFVDEVRRRYAHDEPEAFAAAGETYLPDALQGRQYYQLISRWSAAWRSSCAKSSTACGSSTPRPVPNRAILHEDKLLSHTCP